MIYCPFDTPRNSIQQDECSFYLQGNDDGYCRFNCITTNECRCAERKKEIELLAAEVFLATGGKP